MYHMYIYILCNDVTIILTLACACSDLDLGAMRALGQVLNGLVLQPRGMAGDIFEQKSKLFQRYVYVLFFIHSLHVHMTYTCFLKQTWYPIIVPKALALPLNAKGWENIQYLLKKTQELTCNREGHIQVSWQTWALPNNTHTHNASASSFPVQSVMYASHFISLLHWIECSKI